MENLYFITKTDCIGLKMPRSSMKRQFISHMLHLLDICFGKQIIAVQCTGELKGHDIAHYRRKLWKGC